MNLNQLIDRMTNEELSMPFNLYVEVPRYIRDLEDFEISADSVEDFFDYNVDDDYLLRTVAYIDYERVTVYIDLNDLIVTGYGYEEYDDEGSYCVTAQLKGELLDRYGNPLSESVKRSSEKSGKKVNENNNHRKINEDYDYYNYDWNDKYISLLNNITDYIDNKAGKLADTNSDEYEDFAKSLIAYIINVYEPLN